MRRLALPLLLLLLAGCAGSDEGRKLPDKPIPKLGGGEITLARCAARKCLTVVVAPWCGYCRAATPMMLKLRDHLESKGVPVRFVVGQDNMEAVETYARVFGAGTALDTRNVVRPRGVPQFYVSDDSGDILKAVAGAPQTDDFASVAEYLGFY